MHGSRLKKKAENFRPAPPRTLQPLLLCLCCTSPAVLVPFFGQIQAAAYSRQKLVTKSSTRNAIPSMAFPTWEVSLKKDWCHPTWLDTCMQCMLKLLGSTMFERFWTLITMLKSFCFIQPLFDFGRVSKTFHGIWVFSEICSEGYLSDLWVFTEWSVSALSVLWLFSECALRVLWRFF